MASLRAAQKWAFARTVMQRAGQCSEFFVTERCISEADLSLHVQDELAQQVMTVVCQIFAGAAHAMVAFRSAKYQSPASSKLISASICRMSWRSR